MCMPSSAQTVEPILYEFAPNMYVVYGREIILKTNLYFRKDQT